MKVITIYSGDHCIEVYNSFFGRERVKVNGKIVSSSYSLFGSHHEFTISENGKENKYKVRFRTGLPASVDIYREGQPLIESPPHGFWRVFFYGVIFFLIYKLLEVDLFI